MRHRFSHLAVVFSLAVSSFSYGAEATQPTPSATSNWSKRAPLLEPNSEFSVAELNGKIYVIGGYPSTRITVATVQVYDSRTDRWEYAAPLPQALNHSMAAAVSGKVYAIGGQKGNESDPERAGFVDTVFEYDPAKNAWTRRASMPTMRAGGASAVVDGKIYVAGGRPPHGHDFAVYDPHENRWTVLPNLPTQRNHLAAAAIDGKVYVVGGRFEGGFRSKLSDALEVFDPKTNSWQRRAPMLKPRGGVNGIAANGCLHVFGGEGNNAAPSGVFPDHDFYNPVTDTWQGLAPMPLPVHGVTGAAFIDGWIHLPGGGTSQGGSSGSTIHQAFRAEMRCR